MARERGSKGINSEITTRERFAAGMGIRMRYLEWEGAGTPVLLLHGLTVSAEYWSLTARLLATGHRVMAVDLRGHGHSDKPDWGYDYPTLAADVNQLAEETGIAHAMVAGHSWGAGVALALAATHPRRVSFLAMVDGGFGGRRRADPPVEGVEPDYSRMMAPPEIYRTRQTYLAAAGAGLVAVAGRELEEVLMASVTVNGDGSISERLSRDNHVRILQS
ncbi:MAG: alpha/beta hydrolase, partial [Chloroflexi bacterium]|nr:alpha/beta hydrolase [Chloroflexota bacterium]